MITTSLHQRLSRLAPLGLGAALLAGAALAPAAWAAGSIKAAYVEQVIPGKTFYDSQSVQNSPVSLGPDTGILGVSSITLTNFDTSPQQVFIFAPVLSGSCGSGVIGGSTPRMQVYVPAQATLHLTYPTPLVFAGVSGHTCVAAEVTTLLHGGSVEIDVNGVVN